VKHGASSELRATLSSHAIWNLRYDRTSIPRSFNYPKSSRMLSYLSEFLKLFNPFTFDCMDLTSMSIYKHRCVDGRCYEANAVSRPYVNFLHLPVYFTSASHLFDALLFLCVKLPRDRLLPLMASCTYSLVSEYIYTNGCTHTHWYTCIHISMPRMVLPGLHGVSNGKSRSHKRAWFGGNTGHSTFQVEPTTTSGIQAPLRVQQSGTSVIYSGSDHSVTGTTIHALLLLVDHVDPGVRKYALMKLCDHLPIWRVPMDPKFAGNQNVLWSDVVMEDMPHADDIVATVKQRQQGDTQADVRDAAQVHVLQTCINMLLLHVCLHVRMRY